MSLVNKRSLLKAITWRIISIINGFTIALLLTQSITDSLKLTIIVNITGFILFYLHDVIWHKINFGR